MLNTVFKKRFAYILIGFLLIGGLAAGITAMVANGVNPSGNEWDDLSPATNVSVSPEARVMPVDALPGTIDRLHQDLGEMVPATLSRSKEQLAQMVNADCKLLEAIPASVVGRDSQVESLIAEPLTSFSKSDAQIIARKVIGFCYVSGKV